MTHKCIGSFLGDKHVSCYNCEDKEECKAKTDERLTRLPKEALKQA